MLRPTLCLLSIALLAGCGMIPGSQAVYAPAPVRELTVAATASRAQPVDVTLRLSLPDPSWGYDSTAVEVDDASHVVTFRPQMRNARPDGVSAQVIVPHTATATFTPGATGVYRLQVADNGRYKPVSAEVTITD